MTVHRLLALLLVLAVAVAVSVGGAVASADAASTGSATAKAVKRAQAARCAKLRSAAQRARPRGAAARKAPRCGSARAMRLGTKTQVAARGRWSAPTSAAAAAAQGTTPVALAPGAPLAPPPAPPPAAPVVSTLGVGAYDMGGLVLRLTRTTVPAGILTIFFRNHDVSDHNLWISSPDGEIVERISNTVGEDGGASRTLPVTAGAWRLFCALPDHGAMTRTLTVSP